MTDSLSGFLQDITTDSVELQSSNRLPEENLNYKHDSPRTLKWLRSIIDYSSGRFDVEKAIEELNINIIFEDMGSESAISGYIECLYQENWRIAINMYENDGRQRFTMAHELAHLLFHRQLIQRQIKESSNNRFSEAIKLFRSKDNFKLEEMEANTFAAELLMPSVEFRKLWSDSNTINSISERFDVSLYAAEYRAKKLRLPSKDN